MKKLLSVIFAVIFMLSVFSVAACASDGPKFFSALSDVNVEEETDEPTLAPEENEGETDEEGETVEPETPETIETRTEKWMEKMLECDEWGMIVDDSYSSSEVFYKNGSAAINMYAYGRLYQKRVLKNNDVYTCSTQFPYYYIKTENNFDTSEEFFTYVFEPFAECEFVKSYEENGVYVEEFINSDYGAVKFYFDGDNVVKMEIPKTSEKAEIFYSVKNSDVRLPIFAINITPLYNMFISYYEFILKLALGGMI